MARISGQRIPDYSLLRQNRAVPEVMPYNIPEAMVAPQAPMVAPQAPMPAPQAPMFTPEAPMFTPEAPMFTPEAPMVAPQAPMVAPQAPMVAPQAPMADEIAMADVTEVTPYTPPTSVSGVIAELEAQNNPVPRFSPQADFISEIGGETGSAPQAPPSDGVDDYVPPAPPYSPPTTSDAGVDDYVPDWPTPNSDVDIFGINDTGDDIGEDVIEATTVYEPPPFTPPTLPVAPPVVGVQPEMPTPKTVVQLALEAGANRPKGPVRNFMPTAPANSGWTPGGWDLVTTNTPGSNSGGSQ